MIDPRVSLTISMHSNPGVYALLLGSGLSSSAGILTGWGIVEDMIRRIALTYSEECDPDPASWYTRKFSVEPTYSGLLEALGKSPAERNRLLMSYFEPSDEDQDLGDKRPTKAHIAIAQLVKRGFVRVILTTNFDRLMERALEQHSVAPSVISTPDSVHGASPFAHCRCTVVKLHGDYHDLRSLNTPTELSAYDPRMDCLLDKVLDEYGLIICGWSADWDEALRNAMNRRKGRRYTTWWASRGVLKDRGKQLYDFLDAEQVVIRDADEFFVDLESKLSALEDFDKPHPVSKKIAVSLTKRYLSEPTKHRIALHDLLMEEVNKIAAEITSERFPVDGRFNPEDITNRIQVFGTLSEIALHIIATGCFWDTSREHMSTWIRAITRITNTVGHVGGSVDMIDLRLLSAQIFMYAAGVAFASNCDYSGVHSILSSTTVRCSDEVMTLPIYLSEKARWQDIFKHAPGLRTEKLPVSPYIFNVLRPAFREAIPDDVEFRSAFSHFELLQAYYSADVGQWPIPSKFLRNRRNSHRKCILEKVQTQGLECAFLKSGFCDGTIEDFQEVDKLIDEMLGRLEFEFRC